jgi:hypothetical protein
MKPLSCFKCVTTAALAAVVVGCASGVDSGPPTVVRTPPPQNYESTITNYLAFKIRGPQKNAEINVGAPEPGACSLDAYTTSSRGWVVPVAYATRSGEATGKETIRINTKQYYFWFLGNTIAGITPRIELCPGVGASFESPPADTAPAGTASAAAVRTSGEAQGRDDIAATSATKKDGAQGASKPASGQKSKAAAPAKKKSSAAPKAKPSANTSAAVDTAPR